MTHVVVIGGGLAGLATAAALGDSGYRVTLLESRPYPGGRATSYDIGGDNGPDGGGNVIDNCQHILLRCCTNLLDFYQRLGAQNKIAFSRAFTFIEPGGRRSLFQAGILPAPAHFTGSFLKLAFLNFGEKVALARGILSLQREASRTDLDNITMQAWLEQHGQPARVIERFWRQILVSAINEELDRMAAAHGFQVFLLGFLANRTAYEMGVPAVPLGELYRENAWNKRSNVTMRFRSQVSRVIVENDLVAGVAVGEVIVRGDYYVSAVPYERIAALVPELDLDLSAFEHSPITGIHLWFDRPITDLPHATLLDRHIQWMFNKGEGRYVQLVVSASRDLEKMPRGGVIELALRELAEFFPAVTSAKLEKAHVVKEVRATYSAKPGLEALRPVNQTKIQNLVLAGDWTKSGWPATMEGAVRSGYLAAEAITRSEGSPKKFLLGD